VCWKSDATPREIEHFANLNHVLPFDLPGCGWIGHAVPIPFAAGEAKAKIGPTKGQTRPDLMGQVARSDEHPMAGSRSILATPSGRIQRPRACSHGRA